MPRSLALALSLFCSLLAAAAQRIVIPVNAAITGTFASTAGSPWLAVRNLRQEIRMKYTGNTANSSGGRFWNYPSGTIGLSRSGPTGTGIRFAGTGGTAVTLTVGACPDDDILISIQRVTELQRMFISGRCTDGSGSFSVSSPGYVTTSNADINFSGAFTLTQYASDLSYAWVRFYSDTRVGAFATNDISGTLIAACEFEGNLTCTGPGALTLGTLTQGGNITYESSPIYPPVVDPRFSMAVFPNSGVAATNTSAMDAYYDEFTIRAGLPARLDGTTRTYSMQDDGLLTCRWFQVSGPPGVTELRFSNRNECDTWIHGTFFGEYKIKQIVTDSAGNETSDIITVGAVAADDNWHVIFTDPFLEKMMGPLQVFGRSEWPYVDERAREWLNYFGATAGPLQVTPWNTALGTATFTTGSATVTGASGTNLKTFFCNGGTTSYGGRRIVGWHLINATTGLYGKLSFNVVSCDASANQLTMTSNWPIAGGTLTFSTLNEDDVAAWDSAGNFTIDYYDVVLSFYQAWQRTGLSKYKEYGDTLAEKWITWPTVDWGFPYSDSNRNITSKQLGFRKFSLEGLQIYSHLHGDPADWVQALEWIWDYMKDWAIDHPTDIGERESAFLMAHIARCGQFSTTQAGACRSTLANWLQTYWFADPAVYSYGQQSTGEWRFFLRNEPGDIGGAFNNATFTLTTGASCVTPPATRISNGSPVALNWSSRSSQIAAGWRILFFQSDSGDGIPPASKLENKVYRFTWNSGTGQICFQDSATGTNTTYTGPGGSNRGWTFYYTVGWGAQPFYSGLIGRGLDKAIRALSLDTATYASLIADIKTRIRSLTNWLTTTGRETGQYKGVKKYTGFVNCNAEPTGCEGSIGYAGEIWGLCEADYRYNGPSTLCEEMFGEAWGFLGGPQATGVSNGDLATPSYSYTDLEQGKFLGFYFGYGGGLQYAAIHRGLEEPDTTATTPFQFVLNGGVDSGFGLNGMRMTVACPDGSAHSVQTFTYSPEESSPGARQTANIVVKPRYGRCNARWEYLQDGVAKRSSDWQTIGTK